MTNILKLALLACCALLAFMLFNQQSGAFVHLIVAPAVGLLGSLLLIVLALRTCIHGRRDFQGAHAREGSDA